MARLLFAEGYPNIDLTLYAENETGKRFFRSNPVLQPSRPLPRSVSRLGCQWCQPDFTTPRTRVGQRD